MRYRFKTALASLLLVVVPPVIDAQTITTAGGNGADTYITSTAPTTNYGQLEDVAIKNDSGTGQLHRKGYFRFDLTNAPSTITTASLELVFAFTSVGSPSSSDFLLYGLNDGHPGESWDELSTTWNNAPANGPGGAGVVAGEASSLGTLHLPISTTSVGDIVTFSSPELVSFLQSDTNGLVTILIVRAQTNLTNQSFASKESSQLSPALLRLSGPPPGELTERFCRDDDPNNGNCVCVDNNFELVFEDDVDSNIHEYEEFTPGMTIESVVVLNIVTPMVQGWSFGVTHDESKLSITSEDDISIEETDAEAAAGSPFVLNRLATGGPNNELHGYISAVVLDLVTLDKFLPIQRNTVLRAPYELLEDVGEQGAIIRFVDDQLHTPGAPAVRFNVVDNGICGLPNTITHGQVKRFVPDCPRFDLMDSELAHNIELFGIGTDLCVADLEGFVGVERSCEYVDKTNRPTVDTTIVKLDLAGEDSNCGPVSISLQADRPSTGKVVAQQPNTLFPADSHFDVYIQVEIPELGLTLKNCEPATMRCEVDSLPPYECTYQIGAGFDVMLYRVDEECGVADPAGRITAADHTPKPPPPCPDPNGELVLTIPFVRGDSNTDGKFDIADPVFDLNTLFGNGTSPLCLAATDVNDDGKRDISDPTFSFNYLFGGGRPPPAPFPNCDTDISCLSCESFPPCE